MEERGSMVMGERISVGSPGELLPVLTDRITRGEAFWLTVTGGSMYPTLRNEADSVYIEPLIGMLKVGDIPLVVDGGEHCILHRVIRLEDDVFYLRGDALFRGEGPILKASILGIATHYRRNEKIMKLHRRKPIRTLANRARYFCSIQIRRIYRILFSKKT